MSTVIPLPTLSTLGFVTDPVIKFDMLLSHFFLSDYNQTYLYKGNVTSLPQIIEENGSSINGVLHDLKLKLDTYLTRYYDLANTTVNVSSNLNDLSGFVEITMSVVITDNATQSVFDRLLQATNGKMQKIAKLNN